MPTKPGRTVRSTHRSEARQDEEEGSRRRPWRRHRLGFALVVALALAPTPAAPLAVAQEAGTGLWAGAATRIAHAGGDPVMLREGPGYDAAVLDTLAEGDPLTLTDGPITAADGSVWFGVDAGGRGGFVVADYLAPVSATTTTESGPAGVAEPAPVAETVTTAQPAPAADVAGGEAATARQAVNLRAEPSTAAPVLAVVPSGGVVTRTGEAVGGFAPVAYGGLSGYVAIDLLTTGAAPAAPTMESTAAASGATQPVPMPASVPAVAPASATTTAAVNLRAGPGVGEAVLLVVPAGTALTPTGEAAAGFLGVSFQGTTGWIDAAYLAAPTTTVVGEQPAPPPAVTTSSAPAPPAASPAGAPPAAVAGERGPAGTGAVATTLVNLRAGPSYAEPVLRVLPPGGEVTVTGAANEGFLPVWYNGTDGWIDAQYLDQGAEATAGATVEEPGLVAPEAASAAAPGGGGGLIWPVVGGTWEIMQGYNGSSHQNNSGAWQYYYSFDLVRADGVTAGQPVISPASGTVRWLDPSTGGISIDIGGGYAVALFHATIDGGIEAGDPVQQGQALGSVSGPGGPGFAGSPHVQVTLWETSDGGNWSRSATPFVGEYAIGGTEFPDVGGGNQYRGTTFSP